MKRFHVHISVDDLNGSIRFYSALLGTTPTVTQSDYAKWMLEDPKINFAISERNHTPGVNHIGLQVDSAEELAGMREQLAAADKAMIEQTAAACCYARSDKYWVTDPSGIAWEAFHSLGTIPVFGEGQPTTSESTACCVPLAVSQLAAKDSSCCVPIGNSNVQNKECCV